jgi:hypothetical protein
MCGSEMVERIKYTSTITAHIINKQHLPQNDDAVVRILSGIEKLHMKDSCVVVINGLQV